MRFLLKIQPLADLAFELVIVMCMVHDALFH